MKIHLLTFLLTLFCADLVLAQDTTATTEWKKDRDPAMDMPVETAASPDSRWSIGVHGGVGYRLFRSGVRRDPAREKYLKDLKSGMAFGGDVAYFPWKKVGIGAFYEQYMSKATAEDGLREDVRIRFFGGSLIHRASLKSDRSFIRTALLIGYQPYENRTLAGNAFTMTGQPMGWGVSVGVEQKLSSHFALHLTGTALLGAAYRVVRTTDVNKETLHLGKDDSVDLSRVSLTLGFRFL